MDVNKKMKISEPLVELPIVAFFLAISAGAMDGYAYFTTKTFATFQSGNIILSGFTIATDDFTKLYPTLLSIVSFALGSMCLAFLRDTLVSKNKIWTFTVILIEVFILSFLATNSFHNIFSPLHIAFVLAFVAGFQGNAFHFIDKMLYGNIAVTLNVQLLASFFAEAMMKINSDKRKVLFKKGFDYFVILLGFALGAFITAIAAKHFQSLSLSIPILCLLGIFIVGYRFHKQNKNISIDAD